MRLDEVLQAGGFPTRYVILDFETYFDDEYSLKLMSEWEYINSRYFEVLGLGVKIRGGRANFSFGPAQVDATLNTLLRILGDNFDKATVVCQNCDFDVLVLQEVFGIRPVYTVDIKHLASHQDSDTSHRLVDMAKSHGLQDKGRTEDFKGLHWFNMSPEQGDALKSYCLNDVSLEEQLLTILLPRLSWPEMELWFARHSTQLYLNSSVIFNKCLAKELYAEMGVELNRIIQATGFSEKAIRGNKSIVTLFESVMPANDIPWKQGKNSLIPALAKNDDGCNYLLAHQDPKVSGLMEARLAAKSWPTHLKRILRMADMAKSCGGRLPVPLNYHGCHTGRSSGGKKINLLNLGGSGRAGSGTHPLITKMRGLMRSPDGFKFCMSDSAQIEARVVAWIAGCQSLVEGFAQGRDIYSEFASDLFGEPVRKPKDSDPADVKKVMTIRRGFGKDTILGCLAKGTPILTNNGFKSIEQVSLYDKVWDGVDYVKHDGVIYQGEKLCTRVNDVWMTPEHEVLNSEGWITAGELSIHSQKSEKSTDISQLSKLTTENVAGLSPSNAVARVVEFLLLKEIAWSPENLHAVMSVLKKHPAKLRAIKRGLWNHTSQDFLIELVQSLVGVLPDPTQDIVDEESKCSDLGLRIEFHFLTIWPHYQDGITQNSKLTESTTTETTDPTISDSRLGACKCLTQVRQSITRWLSVGCAEKDLNETRLRESFAQNLVVEKRVTYDILNAGPHKRFQAGNMIVSNCGFGLGPSTYYQKCLENRGLRPLFDSGAYDLMFVDGLIKTYRSKYSEIPAFWKVIEGMFRLITLYPDECVRYGKKEFALESDLLTLWNDNGTVNLQLPSGRTLFYPKARFSKLDKQLSYAHGNLWGGALTENLVQAIARDLMVTWIKNIEDGGVKVVHHIYDEIIGLVIDDNLEGEREFMEDIMKTAPSWAAGLPLAVESKISEVYLK
jgi:hypothetical protein